MTNRIESEAAGMEDLSVEELASNLSTYKDQLREVYLFSLISLALSHPILVIRCVAAIALPALVSPIKCCAIGP